MEEAYLNCVFIWVHRTMCSRGREKIYQRLPITVTCVCVMTAYILPSFDYFGKLLLDYFRSD